MSRELLKRALDALDEYFVTTDEGKSLLKEIEDYLSNPLAEPVLMTNAKPTTPGWYWYELPGSWPLQPVLVFDGGPGYGLMYALDKIDLDHDDGNRDGFCIDICEVNSLWSNLPITAPDTKAEIKLIPDEEISDFCSDMSEELKSVFKMGVRFAEDRIHGIKGRE